MPEDVKDRLARLVSVHDVAKHLDKSLKQIKLWCHIGLAVPVGKIPKLRAAGWQVKNRRIRLWYRKVGNDMRTTWEEVDRFIDAMS